MSAAAPTATAAPVSAGDGSFRHAVSRLWVYVRRNSTYYTVWAVMTLLYVGSMVAIPQLVGSAIDAAVKDHERAIVVERCAWLLAVSLVGAVLRYFSRVLVFNAAREVEYEIRNDLFQHLQALPQSFYFRWRTGDLMSRAVNDLNSVRLLLGPGLLSVVQTPALFIGFLIAMFQANALLAFLVMLPYPLFIVFARAYGGMMYARNLAVQQGLSEMSNHVQEAVAGIPVVKAYAMEAEQQARFAGSSEELYQRHISLVKVIGSMPAVIGMLPALSMWIVLLVGGPQIQDGRMEVSQFFEFAMYIYALTFPTFTMGWAVALVQRGAASMQRIDEVLSVDPAIADRPGLAAVAEPRGEVEFRNLTFSYATGDDGDREPALRGVNLHVPAGTTLGVVGPVGSGKSTLASVIPRLYEVERGQLFIDGVDVNDVPLAALRSGIAMVPQDSFLFSMTLAENIAYGVPDATQEQVEEAARRAQLAKDVGDLPNAYRTIVGERGVMLSGGQRQRTALARALALRPEILILDDTLSAVDAETEAAIQAELHEVFADRTVIVVANRISSVQECDQIVVLEAGRVIEQGSHAELLQHGGLYARLAREQESEERVPLPGTNGATGANGAGEGNGGGGAS